MHPMENVITKQEPASAKRITKEPYAKIKSVKTIVRILVSAPRMVSVYAILILSEKIARSRYARTIAIVSIVFIYI